ncbi:hypothetical protein BIV57_17425 [Mangrovactinospora gilvigrisea]|uniref:Uncharacterized protein n=1 Tax=Mangrovactinospora gilvigrisea TaxID=1428644 RepID=A0A1J7BC41_9ACTN|nr:hypothetical protein BIV57_17425 [Mangrovactinospora gilvigrisea]
MVVVVGGAGAASAATVRDHEPRATKADLRARVDRVAAGLRRGTVYYDPETTAGVNAPERAAIAAALARSTVPVHLVMIPLTSDDESGGNADYFLQAVHRRLRAPGLYVQADSPDGGINAAAYGIGRRLPAQLPRAVAYPPDAGSAAGTESAGRLPQRLTQLVTLVEKLPRLPAAHASPAHASPGASAKYLTGKPSFFSGPFWPGLTLIGPCAALLVYAAWRLAGRAAEGRRALRLADPERPDGPIGNPQAAPRPSAEHLARLAAAELAALERALDAVPPEAPGAARAADYRDAGRDLDADLRRPRDAGAWDSRRVSPAAGSLAVAVLGMLGRLELRAGGPARDAGDPEASPLGLCDLNPLHGPAVLRRPADLSGHPAERPALCEECRVLAVLTDRRLRTPVQIGRHLGELADRLLRLPREETAADPDGPAVPYLEVAGPWGPLGPSPDRLPERIRAHLGG